MEIFLTGNVKVLYGYRLCLRENGKLCTKTFSVQERYLKRKHLKMQQTKCSVNARNVFYQLWSMRKVCVDSENNGGKDAHTLDSVAMLFNNATTNESGRDEHI